MRASLEPSPLRQGGFGCRVRLGVRPENLFLGREEEVVAARIGIGMSQRTLAGNDFDFFDDRLEVLAERIIKDVVAPSSPSAISPTAGVRTAGIHVTNRYEQMLRTDDVSGVRPAGV